MTRKNPILPGFNPDPSICRAGDDYYIATSTFEWYPGVRIYRSKDLSNWSLCATPLDRVSLLDMRGTPDSGGVWAPDLTFHDDKFWLVYTHMQRHQGSVKDARNYLTTAPSIEGPWSDPVFLNASGFDPALFHDDDGQSWLVQMVWRHDPEPSHFGGIYLQKFDREKMALVRAPELIFEGTSLGLTEGPHLYKKDGYYHLLTAEGGTGYGHACTWARSKSITGPWELHPQTHILTAKDAPDHPIQRAGHGDLIKGPDGRHWLVYLMGRPLGDGRCTLGRETAIAEVEWRDGWPWVKGGSMPAPEVDLPLAPEQTEWQTDFKEGLPEEFQWLRVPETDRLFKTGVKGLSLFGRESIGSWYEQSLVARRQTTHYCQAECVIDFDPKDEREQAGLCAYYSRHAHYFLAITRHKGARVLRIIAAEANSRGGSYSYPGEPVSLPETGSVTLCIEISGETLQFIALIGGTKTSIGPSLDATILSDEASVGTGGGCFTGNFLGVCAVDMNGHGATAHVSRFDYVSG